MRKSMAVSLLLAVAALLPTAACAEPYRGYAYGDGGYYRPYYPAPIYRAPPVYRAPSGYDWVHPQFGPSYRVWRHDSPGFGDRSWHDGGRRGWGGRGHWR